MAIFKQLYLAVIILVFLLAGSIYAVDRDAEIVAFTDKAIAHMKKVGNQQAYKDFKNRNGEFFKGEVYVVTLDLDGICRSQPVNPRLIGKNFISLFNNTINFIPVIVSPKIYPWPQSSVVKVLHEF